MSDNAILSYNGKSIELPVVEGAENEHGLDICKLRKETGLVTLDYGYLNTGSPGQTGFNALGTSLTWTANTESCVIAATVSKT